MNSYTFKSHSYTKLEYQFKGGQAVGILSYLGEDQPFFSSQAFKRLTEALSNQGRLSALLNLPLQLLFSSRNTITQSRITFKQINLCTCGPVKSTHEINHHSKH